jgi:hypothetical protein
VQKDAADAGLAQARLSLEQQRINNQAEADRLRIALDAQQQKDEQVRDFVDRITNIQGQ